MSPISLKLRRWWWFLGLVCYTGAYPRSDPPVCPAGFSGTDCSLDYTGCLDYPCINGGNCTAVLGGGYTCTCLEGFKGDDCQLNFSNCTLAGCLNGGTCNSMVTGQSLCVCPTGYSGSLCQSNFAGCNSSPCANGGTCLLVPGGGFSCICPFPHTGDDCSVAPLACNATAPCLNGGTCAHLELVSMCYCPLGFDGDHCETRFASCVNGGSALSAGDPCTCPPPYYGSTCQFWDGCSGSPFPDLCIYNPFQSGGFQGNLSRVVLPAPGGPTARQQEIHRDAISGIIATSEGGLAGAAEMLLGCLDFNCTLTAPSAPQDRYLENLFGVLLAPIYANFTSPYPLLSAVELHVPCSTLSRLYQGAECRNATDPSATVLETLVGGKYTCLSFREFYSASGCTSRNLRSAAAKMKLQRGDGSCLVEVLNLLATIRNTVLGLSGAGSSPISSLVGQSTCIRGKYPYLFFLMGLFP